MTVTDPSVPVATNVTYLSTSSDLESGNHKNGTADVIDVTVNIVPTIADPNSPNTADVSYVVANAEEVPTATAAPTATAEGESEEERNRRKATEQRTRTWGATVSAIFFVWLLITIYNDNPSNHDDDDSYFNRATKAAYTFTIINCAAAFCNIFFAYYRDNTNPIPFRRNNNEEVEGQSRRENDTLFTLRIRAIISIFDLFQFGIAIWGVDMFVNRLSDINSPYNTVIQVYAIVFLITVSFIGVAILLSCCGICCLMATTERT